MRDLFEVLSGFSPGPQLLIGLDVDGTILRHDTSLSARVSRAIKAQIAAGTHVIIATGRGLVGTQEALRALEIDSAYAVCSNGAIIAAFGRDPQLVPTEPILPQVCEGEVRIVRAHTFDPSTEIARIAAALPEVTMAVESLSQPTRLSADFPPGELSGHTVVVPIEQLAVPDATRVTIRAPHLSAVELLAAIEDIGLSGVEYAVGWSAWMDLAPAGISKAVGLAEVQQMLGATNTITVGDSGNDCDMLAWADAGIVMANARADIYQYADAVAPHVDDDGLAVVLEALL